MSTQRHIIPFIGVNSVPMRYLKEMVILFLMPIVFVCCSKQTDGVIDSELQPYIDDFIEEAKNRNVEINISELSASLERISDRGVVGQCSQVDGEKNVTIEQSYWNRIGAVDREYVVFHELGHCLLGRSHNDNIDDSGNCESIMQSGNTQCDKNYNDITREDYLNELFK